MTAHCWEIVNGDKDYGHLTKILLQRINRLNFWLLGNEANKSSPKRSLKTLNKVPK